MGRRFDKPTLGETMLQVTSHSTYHRGPLRHLLETSGVRVTQSVGVGEVTCDLEHEGLGGWTSLLGWVVPRF